MLSQYPCPLGSLYRSGLSLTYAYRSHASGFPAPGMRVSAWAKRPRAGSLRCAQCRLPAGIIVHQPDACHLAVLAGVGPALSLPKGVIGRYRTPSIAHFALAQHPRNAVQGAGFVPQFCNFVPVCIRGNTGAAPKKDACSPDEHASLRVTLNISCVLSTPHQ